MVRKVLGKKSPDTQTNRSLAFSFASLVLNSHFDGAVYGCSGQTAATEIETQRSWRCTGTRRNCIRSQDEVCFSVCKDRNIFPGAFRG